jgi:hypothetical protein
MGAKRKEEKKGKREFVKCAVPKVVPPKESASSPVLSRRACPSEEVNKT